MEKVERTLGVLVEQGRWMTQEIGEIRKDIKELHSFKWKILGFASCAAFIASMLVEMIRK